MQFSRYLRVFPFEERPGHLLVYSTKKAALLLLKEEIYRSIENSTLPREQEELLARYGVIVPDREEEKREMYGHLDRLNAKGALMNVCVYVNMDCNFSCVYCYEDGMKGKLSMSDETARLLVDFIKERFTPEKKMLNLDFYGGEPLLSAGLIKKISAELQSFAASRGAVYTFSLVTNGSLFKRKIAEELKELGLKAVKVTLDGPAETHDRYRPFKSGAGSFDTIIGNIKETCDLTRIAIGGNFDRESCESFVSLLDCLEREGLTPDKIAQVQFNPVAKRAEHDTSPADYTDGCMSVNEPWIWKAGLLLREEVLKRGYYTPKVMPLPCQVEVRDHYVVHYDGVLYKCPAFIGREGFGVGSLRDGMADYSARYGTGIWKKEECIACEYLPLCFGGCRYFSYIRGGNASAGDCKKDYLDATLETILKQDIKYRKK